MKDKYCMISILCDSENKQINKQTSEYNKKEIDTQT